MSIIGVSLFAHADFCAINIYAAKWLTENKTDTKDNKHAKDT